MTAARTTIERACGSQPYGPLRWWCDIEGDLHMTCANGHIGLLGPEFLVDDDGNVNPSVDCPRAGCAFHAFVRLAGFAIEGEFIA